LQNEDSPLSNTGQWGLYVAFPAGMLLFSICPVVFFEKNTDARIYFLLLVQFAPILLFLTIYGGGV